VVGHTDSDDSFELNSKLSLDQAKAVKSYLEKNHGVASNRLFAEGVGHSYLTILRFSAVTV